ncbi:MAG TPA: hypothetical protein VLC71_12870 [Thermomonas sp.]|nr:hypothetical protein [Thermomonas sp.]
MKAAVGDKPVFAYIASLPQPQRGIRSRQRRNQATPDPSVPTRTVKGST